MEELPFNRPETPVSSQAFDPALLQQLLVALTNLQLQESLVERRGIREPKVPDVPT